MLCHHYGILCEGYGILLSVLLQPGSVNLETFDLQIKLL